MHHAALISQSEAACRLGVHRATIADLVTLLGITPKTTAGPGRAKGLDPRNMARLRRYLRLASGVACAS
jgi:plasmid maintenance system antidote protein VapI